MSGAGALNEVRAWLAAAQQPGGVVVLTGAGMSAESGIPTFRDAMHGLWSRFDPTALASEAGFRADPARVWQWYAERRAGVRAAQPNAGHRALADFARRHPGVLTLVTQNVDDLHARAGQPEVLPLHGDILQDRWLDPCPHPPQACTPGPAPEDAGPPRCVICGNRLRPGVVWFGETLPPEVLRAAEDAVRRCRLLLVVGTSGAVWPAAGLAGLGRRAGATVVVLNPQPSDIDGEARLCLRGTAAQLLPPLLAENPEMD